MTQVNINTDLLATALTELTQMHLDAQRCYGELVKVETVLNEMATVGDFRTQITQVTNPAWTSQFGYAAMLDKATAAQGAANVKQSFVVNASMEKTKTGNEGKESNLALGLPRIALKIKDLAHLINMTAALISRTQFEFKEADYIIATALIDAIYADLSTDEATRAAIAGNRQGCIDAVAESRAANRESASTMYNEAGTQINVPSNPVKGPEDYSVYDDMDTDQHAYTVSGPSGTAYVPEDYKETYQGYNGPIDNDRVGPNSNAAMNTATDFTASRETYVMSPSDRRGSSVTDTKDILNHSSSYRQNVAMNAAVGGIAAAGVLSAVAMGGAMESQQDFLDTKSATQSIVDKYGSDVSANTTNENKSTLKNEKIKETPSSKDRLETEDVASETDEEKTENHKKPEEFETEKQQDSSDKGLQYRSSKDVKTNERDYQEVQNIKGTVDSVNAHSSKDIELPQDQSAKRRTVND